METIEFDTAYSAVTGERTGDYVPSVEHSDDWDILIDGNVTASRYHGSDPQPAWNAITCKTGQYGYHGAILHASENASEDTIREWVRDAGGDVFAVVAVEAPCTDDDPCFPDLGTEWCVDNGCDDLPAGWAVIYRAA